MCKETEPDRAEGGVAGNADTAELKPGDRETQVGDTITITISREDARALFFDIRTRQPGWPWVRVSEALRAALEGEK